MFDDYDITIVNSYVDKDSRTTKYKSTHLIGVDWQDKVGVNIYQTRGIVNGDDIKIFIPFNVDSENRQYIKPKAYKQLSNLERDAYYTFNTGDKVIKGLIYNEITSESLRQIENTYDDIVTIRNIVTCDMMEHFELECE